MRLINAIAQALECILSAWPKDKNASTSDNSRATSEGDCARQLRSVLLGLLGKQQILGSAAKKKSRSGLHCREESKYSSSELTNIPQM